MSDALDRLSAKIDKASALADDLAAARLNGMRSLGRDMRFAGIFLQVVIVLSALGWALGVAFHHEDTVR